ncbi:hypothetical protein MM213_13715 [Belliella sp. R4-6]|uniref:Uncharacterized protein n=1 Tax=Belliella alkalica TaxID=1730871 RepID=A0ABS9VDP2_9BACT|nr:hypothetical protein [Belliella alkalica]MCH7414551.1 hypothetical protein [Belliella alkalica]
MKNLLVVLSIVGLLFTIIPPFLVFSAVIEPATSKNLMLAGTVIWFTSAPFWLNKKSENDYPQ